MESKIIFTSEKKPVYKEGDVVKYKDCCKAIVLKNVYNINEKVSIIIIECYNKTHENHLILNVSSEYIKIFDYDEINWSNKPLVLLKSSDNAVHLYKPLLENPNDMVTVLGLVGLHMNEVVEFSKSNFQLFNGEITIKN